MVHTCVDFMVPGIVGIPILMGFAIEKLLLNPAVERKCQAEIDEIIGRTRLPTLDDRKRYITHDV